MPKYISKKEIEHLCKVYKIDKLEITPRPWYRSWPILKNMLTYQVLDRVKFHIHIEAPQKQGTFLPGKNHITVKILENLPNKGEVALFDSNDQDFDVAGNTITSMGDVMYSIFIDTFGWKITPILSTKVTSLDTAWSRVLWLIIGALVACPFTILAGLIIALITGFISIDPAWKIWWP